MKHFKILDDLRSALEPYSFFWEEWIINVDCNLEIDEIKLINNYIKNDFSLNIFDLVEYYKKVDSIKRVMRKLELGYQVFKDFVVVNFLSTIIEIGMKYGYNEFMQTPIALLYISEAHKKAFLKFNAPTLRQLFISNKVENFCRGWMYGRIVAFQIINKRQNILLSKDRVAATLNTK